MGSVGSAVKRAGSRVPGPQAGVAARIVGGLLAASADRRDTRFGVFSEVERDSLETLCRLAEERAEGRS